MQQELIDMLEETISYVEVWHKEDQDVIDKAEALVEKAKNNAPAVQVYQLAKLGGPTETAWIDVTQEVYEDAGFYKDDFKRRILSATPATAPAQEFNKSVADAEIKALYVESQGSDKGWLGIEGSYFIGGVVAARKQKAAPAPAQEVGLTNHQFDLICQALDKADTVTMEGDYMLDSDDCIAVVRVMQVLFDIAAIRAKEKK